MKETKSKKNKIERLVGVICLLVMFIIWNVHPTYIFAQVSESEIETEATRETASKDNKEEKEVRFPNKLEAKEPPSDNQGGGSQSDIINKGIPTAEGSAKAELIENVNNANQEYPIHHGDSSDNKETDKYSADARQFITFQTKNGKTFHLIINHDEQGENVMLLTEVSEDDLLNMVEIKEKPKEVVKEEPIKDEPKEEAKPEKKEEKSSTGTYILLALVTLGALGAGYYFKVAKKKEDKELEAFEEDDDFFSEAEGSEETENEEVENQELEDETEDSEED